MSGAGATPWWWVLTAALAGSGCTITTSDPGADGGAASDGGGGTQKVGDQCEEIYTELCTQAINRCGITGYPLDQCVASNKQACCQGSVCDQISQSPSSAVDACKSAIDAEDCYAISIDNNPPACQGVPKKP